MAPPSGTVPGVQSAASHLSSDYQGAAHHRGEWPAPLSSHWQVQSYRPEQHQAFTYFGFYEHGLRLEGDQLRIARKKVLLLNDVVEAC